jgi:hypothetical protein
LKKIKILGFGSPGLKIHVLKESFCPAPVLEGEGRIYCIIFLANGHLGILGECPETPKTTYFWVRLMGFWPGSSASGVEKWISGFFRVPLVETRNPLFYTREKFSRPVERPGHFFTPRTPPAVTPSSKLAFTPGNTKPR